VCEPKRAAALTYRTEANAVERQLFLRKKIADALLEGIGAECVQHTPSFWLLLHHRFCCGRVKPFRMVHAVVYAFRDARGVQRLDHGLIALEWPPLWPDDARVRVRFI
jgi:hypothetical protein